MQLIINADDFGLTKATNEAVIKLAAIGTISSSTVMVNMPYAKEAVKLTDILGFGIGLHFNLTQGYPITAPHEIPSLVKEDGSFFSVHDFRSKIKKGKLNNKEVLTELYAQFQRLESIVGKNISHIDSHQEINKYSLINRALITFNNQKKLPIGLRWYNKIYLDQTDTSNHLIEPSIFNITKFGLKRSLIETYFKIRRKKLLQTYKLTDGMLYSGNHNMRTLLQQLIRIPSDTFNEKVFEVMVHPATSTNELSETKMMDARVEEYEILKSPEFQEFIQKNKLLSFADLK